MDSFSIFFKRFQESLVTESLDARVDELVSSNIFSHFGREFIEDRFDWYKRAGIVPTVKVSKNASRTGDTKTTDLEERDYEEILPYIFKYLDKEIRDTLEKVYKDNEKKSNKLKNNYDGVTQRDVLEDASQIKGVFTNWLVFRHNKKSGVPKSLRQKIDFTDLQKKVDDAYKELTGATVSGDAKGGVDADMPEGFHFIKESGGLRLYKWTELGTVCSLDPKVKQNWLSIVISLAGDSSDNWCVASGDFASQYGKPDGSGKFQHPYYMIRKKDGGGFKPYVLMHGDSLQCKDKFDDAISEEIADEIYPIISDRLEEIIFGNV